MSEYHDDLTTELSRELRGRVDTMHGASLGLGDVQLRARSIRRRRTATAVIGAAAAVALIVPTAAVAGRNLKHDHSLPPATQSVEPSPSPTTVAADPHAALDVTGLPTGETPAGGYLYNSTLHLPDGETRPVPTTDPVVSYAVLADGAVVYLTRDDQGVTHVEVTDAHGVERGPYPATDGLSVDSNAFSAAWMGPDGHPRFWNAAFTQPGRMDAHVPGTGYQIRAMTDGDCTVPSGSGCAVLVRTTDPSTGATRDWLALWNGTVTQAAPSDRFVGLTGLGRDGEEVGLTRFSDTGSCSGVADRSGSLAWKTCNHILLTLSPRSFYVSADAPYHDGPGSTVFAAYGAANGDLVFEHRSTEATQAFVQTSTWENDSYVLANVFQGGRWSVVRFGVDGSMEVSVPPVTGDVASSPIVLPN
jgi:hypothetical protein